MTDTRYAIFFVPPADSALYRFGAAALGYDAYSGDEVPFPVDEADWRDITAEPRRYGFHATLKAPFRLRWESVEDDLIGFFAKFAREQAPPPRFPATLQLIEGFAALVPAAPVPEIDALAAKCVRAFDRLRNPMSEAERKRRLAASLTARQVGHLDDWGCPYVFEDFRFHVTLTGRLAPERTAPIVEVLTRSLAEASVPTEITIDSIALLRQDGLEARFRVIRQAKLDGRAAHRASQPARGGHPSTMINSPNRACGNSAPSARFTPDRKRLCTVQ